MIRHDDPVSTRAATPADSQTVIDLAVSSGLFPADDVDIVATLMADYTAASRQRDHHCLLITQDDTAIGVAYYQPAPATDRTWYLT